ncbi:MAG: hypothetical protein JXB50_02130 [Spirochaetes bacterium]|nr:hypothetical protein [Spirochaetota bacterium]
MKKKYFLVLFFMLITCFFIYSDNNIIDPNEIYIALDQVEYFIKNIAELKNDNDIQIKILELRSLAKEYQKYNKKIYTSDELFFLKIDILDQLIETKRYLNVDDGLNITLKYLKNRFVVFEEKIKEEELKLIAESRDKVKELLQKLDLTVTDEMLTEITREIVRENRKNNLNLNLTALAADQETLKVIYPIFLSYLMKKIAVIEEKISFKKIIEGDEKIVKTTEIKKEDIENVDQLYEKIEELSETVELLSRKSVSDEELLNSLLDELKNLNIEIKDDIKKRLDKINDDRKKEIEIFKKRISSDQWGKGFGFSLSVGQAGIYTTCAVGILSPKIANLFTIALAGNIGSSLPGTVTSERTRTSIATGSLSIAFFSPMFSNFIRIYLGAEMHIGITFGFYDFDIFLPSVTLGGYGFGGIEFYLISQIAFFIEAGGGVMHIFSDVDQNDTTLDTYDMRLSNNNGTGIKLNFGVKFYMNFTKKSKPEKIHKENINPETK